MTANPQINQLIEISRDQSINQYINGGRFLDSFSIVLMINYNFVNNE